MKKVIKILPLLFLLSSLSNLACSQNVKTLAITEVVDNEYKENEYEENEYEENDEDKFNEIIQETDIFLKRLNMITNKKKMSNENKLTKVKKILTNLIEKTDEIETEKDKTSLNKKQLSNLNKIKKILTKLETKLNKKSKSFNLSSLNSDVNKIKKILTKLETKLNKKSKSFNLSSLNSDVNKIKKILAKINNKTGSSKKKTMPNDINNINKKLIEIENKINQLNNSNNKEELHNIYKLTKYMSDMKRNTTYTNRIEKILTKLENKLNNNTDMIMYNSKTQNKKRKKRKKRKHNKKNKSKLNNKNNVNNIMIDPIEFISARLNKAELKMLESKMMNFENNFDFQPNNFEYIQQYVNDLRIFVEDTEKFNENEINSIINAIQIKLNAELFEHQKIIRFNNQQLHQQNMPTVNDVVKNELKSIFNEVMHKWERQNFLSLKRPDFNGVPTNDDMSTDETRFLLKRIEQTLFENNPPLDINNANRIRYILLNMLQQLKNKLLFDDICDAIKIFENKIQQSGKYEDCYKKYAEKRDELDKQLKELFKKKCSILDYYHHTVDFENAIKQLESLKLQKDEIQKQLDTETQDDKKSKLEEQITSLSKQIEWLDKKIEDTKEYKKLDEQMNMLESQHIDLVKKYEADLDSMNVKVVKREQLN